MAVTSGTSLSGEAESGALACHTRDVRHIGALSVG
jgi:hypothetical protein